MDLVKFAANVAPKIDKRSFKRGSGSCLGSMSWPRWRPRWPRGALRGSKMANLVPRCGNIAPKKPPDAAKIAILGACWELVGSFFFIWHAFWLTGSKSKNIKKSKVFGGFLKIWGLAWMPNRRKSGQVGCVASKLGCHGRS